MFLLTNSNAFYVSCPYVGAAAPHAATLYLDRDTNDKATKRNEMAVDEVIEENESFATDSLVRFIIF